MLRRRKALCSLVLVGASALAWLGCQASQATELVAGISTQVQVPRDMQTIQIRVAVSGSTVFCQNYAVYDGHVELPRTLGTLPRQEAGTPVTISVVGYLASDDSDSNSLQGAIAAGAAFGCSTEASVNSNPTSDQIGSGAGAKVLRVARQPYSPDQILFVPMPIKYSCFDTDCGPSGGDKTCKAGQCVDSTLDITKLVQYQDSDVYGGDATCFAVFGQSACFATVANITPLTVDDTNCIYALPGAIGAPPLPAGVTLPSTGGLTLPPDGLNVRVYYDSGITNEILDLDPVEGFSVPNSAQPQIFQLAPGLCQMVHGSGTSTHRITGIEVNPICRPKLVSQSICAADALAIVGADPDGTVANPDGTCTTAQLVPATAAVEFVVDPTSHAVDFYRAATGFVSKLSDPGLKNLSIGVRFMADGNATCPTTSPLASSDLPLTATTNPALATYIQGLSSGSFGAQVLSDTSPDLNVSAGLTAAYADLTTNAGTAATKSVIVIAHSSLTQSCNTGGATSQTPAQVIAANAGISTSVIALDGDTECSNPALSSAVGSGNCIPTTNGSATQDAILKEFTAAAACTYLVSSTATPDAVWFTDPTQPLSAATVAVTPSTATTAAQCRATGSGFLVTGGDLILCKDSCTAYQNALTAAAIAANATTASSGDAGTSDGGTSTSGAVLPTIIPLFSMIGSACVVPKSTGGNISSPDAGTISSSGDGGTSTVDASAPPQDASATADSGSGNGCAPATFSGSLAGPCIGEIVCTNAGVKTTYDVSCDVNGNCSCTTNGGAPTATPTEAPSICGDIGGKVPTTTAADLETICNYPPAP